MILNVIILEAELESNSSSIYHRCVINLPIGEFQVLACGVIVVAHL